MLDAGGCCRGTSLGRHRPERSRRARRPCFESGRTPPIPLPPSPVVHQRMRDVPGASTHHTSTGPYPRGSIPLDSPCPATRIGSPLRIGRRSPPRLAACSCAPVPSESSRIRGRSPASTNDARRLRRRTLARCCLLPRGRRPHWSNHCHACPPSALHANTEHRAHHHGSKHRRKHTPPTDRSRSHGTHDRPPTPRRLVGNGSRTSRAVARSRPGDRVQLHTRRSARRPTQAAPPWLSCSRFFCSRARIGTRSLRELGSLPAAH